MRKFFANFLLNKMQDDKSIVLCTGDLGYGLFDNIRLSFPEQFYNFGSSETLMMGASCGMALESKKPFVYSITPFALYRPFEVIRNYVDYESIPVTIVGGGRDRDYGYLGFSHWAEDDLLFMNNFKNITCYKPDNEEELKKSLDNIFLNRSPSYINLIK
jgi:transketolase